MTSRTTPTHLQSVPGCPPTVQIYRIEANRYWQFRFFVQRKYVRRSTQVTNKAEAIQKAKEFYRDIILKEKQDIAVHPTTFYAVTKQFLDWQMIQVNLERIVKRGHQEDIYKLKSDILPFFQSMEVSSITKATIEEYLNTLTQRKLSKSTLNKHVSVIRKILGFAVDRNIIKAAPGCPRIGVENNPRPYFDSRAWSVLSVAAQRCASNGRVYDYILNGKPIRKLRYTQDFADLINFAVHVFIRISDIKMLQHKHVKVVNDGSSAYLEIFPPDSKTAKTSGKSKQSSCSMSNAVRIYKRLQARHTADGFGQADDFVFYPQYRNRDYAMQLIRRLSTNILDKLYLRKDEWGNNRTLYSLRHSALMFRLLEGDNIDIFLLAKNALTSVEMLQKFYLSHAESKMRIKELQSFKDIETKVGHDIRAAFAASGTTQKRFMALVREHLPKNHKSRQSNDLGCLIAATSFQPTNRAVTDVETASYCSSGLSIFPPFARINVCSACPLLAVKQTSIAHVSMSAFDPKRTSKVRHTTAPDSNLETATAQRGRPVSGVSAGTIRTIEHGRQSQTSLVAACDLGDSRK